MPSGALGGGTVQGRDAAYTICAAAVAVLLVYKLWHVRARWRSPRVRAVWTTTFFTALSVWFAAPASRAPVQRLIDVPNIGTPLYFACTCASTASFLTLALLWRYPARTARPKIRRAVAAYALVATGIAVLFAFSTVPESRPTDFGIHYATQPTVGALMMLWLVSSMIGFGVLARWCFAWAASEDYAQLPWLRRGLRLYGSVGLVVIFLPITGIIGVVSNWLGTKALNTVVTTGPVIFFPVGALLLAAALLVPAWGPRWPAVRRWFSRWRVFWPLRALHRELRHISPDAVMVARGRRLDPHHRVRRLTIELNDLRWELAPLFDPAVGAAAARLGRAAGLDGERLSAAVEAAQLKAASQAWDGEPQPAGSASPGNSGSDGGSDGDGDARDGTSIDAELEWWAAVARAFRTSPVVTGALARTAASAEKPDTGNVTARRGALS